MSRSWNRFVAQNPIFLLLCVGNGEAAGRCNRIQSCLWFPPKMDKRAGRSDGCPADASPAMGTDTDSGTETFGQICREFPEANKIRRNMYVREWKADKLHSNLTCYSAFLRKSERSSFLLFQE